MAVGTVFVAEKLWRRNRVAAVALMVAVNVATARHRRAQLFGGIAAAVGSRTCRRDRPARHWANGFLRKAAHNNAPFVHQSVQVRAAATEESLGRARV